MSLILDALRKSEAERRRGQAPSLYAQMPSPATRLRPVWMPWLAVAIGVLLLVGVAVWFGRDADEPATKEELVDKSDGESLVPKPPAAVIAENPAAAAPPPVVAPAPMAAPAPAAPKTPTVDALVQPAPPGAKPTTPALSTPAVTAPAAPASTPPPADDSVPPVAVLDPSTRGSLPPMKLSMHVYNTDPALRFAIIDGQRVAEGAQLGSAIVLEIRRDGVLLDVGGRRVLLPRP